VEHQRNETRRGAKAPASGDGTDVELDEWIEANLGDEK
jgi:hypothetical protein